MSAYYRTRYLDDDDTGTIELLTPRTKFILHLIGLITGALATAAITITAAVAPELAEVVAAVAGAVAAIVTTILCGIGIAVKD